MCLWGWFSFDVHSPPLSFRHIGGQRSKHTLQLEVPPSLQARSVFLYLTVIRPLRGHMTCGRNAQTVHKQLFLRLVSNVPDAECTVLEEEEGGPTGNKSCLNVSPRCHEICHWRAFIAEWTFLHGRPPIPGTCHVRRRDVAFILQDLFQQSSTEAAFHSDEPGVTFMSPSVSDITP